MMQLYILILSSLVLTREFPFRFTTPTQLSSRTIADDPDSSPPTPHLFFFSPFIFFFFFFSSSFFSLCPFLGDPVFRIVASGNSCSFFRRHVGPPPLSNPNIPPLPNPHSLCTSLYPNFYTPISVLDLLTPFPDYTLLSPSHRPFL